MSGTEEEEPTTEEEGAGGETFFGGTISNFVGFSSNDTNNFSWDAAY